MKICTIGFTRKTAQRFFALLAENGVERVVDIRLKPDGQLSGFAKAGDLAWFLQEINHCDYVHLPQLAPPADLLSDYRSNHDWSAYVPRFEAAMDERNIPATLDQASFAERVSCLLCSEPGPEQCHRRLVAARLARAWPDVEVIHLV
jgi:uncharacterized protein (DUF488 family)